MSLLSYNYSYKLEKKFLSFAACSYHRVTHSTFPTFPVDQLQKVYSSKSSLNVETVNCTTTLMSIHDALKQIYKTFINHDTFRSQIERLHFSISTDKRTCSLVVGRRKRFTKINSITDMAPCQRLSLDGLRTVTS